MPIGAAKIVCAKAACLLNGWSRRVPIAIPYSLVTANLTGFTWILQASAFPSEFWTNINSNGSDIRFTQDRGGTIGIPSLITSINKSGHTITIRLKPSNLSSSINTTVWCWYGNSLATIPLASDSNFGSNNVYDSNQTGVWPLDDNAANTTVIDITSNANNGVAQQNTNVLAVTGQIDGALSFNGGLQGPQSYIDTFGTSISSAGNSRTVIVWVNSNSTDRQAVIATRPPTGVSSGFTISINQTTIGNLNYNHGSSSRSEAGGITTGTWFQLAITYNSSSHQPILFVNGSALTKPSAVSAEIASSINGLFGVEGGSTLSNWFNGNMCEVEISNIIRSNDWIKTTYNNQSNLSTSGSSGTPETP